MTNLTELHMQLLRVVSEVGDPLMSHFYEAIDAPKDEIRDAVRHLVKTGLLRMKEDDIDHDWTYGFTQSGRAVYKELGAA